jgi:hypothetical protein
VVTLLRVLVLGLTEISLRVQVLVYVVLDINQKTTEQIVIAVMTANLLFSKLAQFNRMLTFKEIVLIKKHNKKFAKINAVAKT